MMMPCGVPVDLLQKLTDWCVDADVRAMAVDACGFMPLRLVASPKPSAAVYREYMHKHAGVAFQAAPEADPLAKKWQCDEFDEAWITSALKQFPAAHDILDDPSLLTTLPIDQDVLPIPGRGGEKRPERIAGVC